MRRTSRSRVKFARSHRFHVPETTIEEILAGFAEAGLVFLDEGRAVATARRLVRETLDAYGERTLTGLLATIVDPSGRRRRSPSGSPARDRCSATSAIPRSRRSGSSGG
jgi:hypothetical protein